ncbi:major facilitator superfamily transporter [Colletotrichum filicis]|nr:major facilitator superfamily transporter [Colletotrichum filicis]
MADHDIKGVAEPPATDDISNSDERSASVASNSAATGAKSSEQAAKSLPKTGADAALQLLNETGALARTIDPELNRRLKHRIDTHIMPLICIVYFLQYIDKTAISYASVTGIQQSTGLHGNCRIGSPIRPRHTANCAGAN